MSIHISKGTSRITILMDFVPTVVLKIPRIRFREGFRVLVADRRKWGRKETWDENVWWSIGFCFYKGILENWREYTFYRKTKHAFLQPTWFSFLGLINIQKRGTDFGHTADQFYLSIHEATDGECTRDAHHFSNSDNFCVSDGVRILDYGSLRTQSIIEKHGNKIAAALNRTIWVGAVFLYKIINSVIVDGPVLPKRRAHCA